MISTFATSQSAAAAVPKSTDVVIVGAGLSGLAAAYELKKAGLKYHILELTPRVGGRVRTVKYDFPGEPATFADSGMEEYWESNPAVQVLKELKLPTLHDVAISSLALGGKIYELGDEDQAQFYGRIFSKSELEKLEGFKKEVAPMIEKMMNAWKKMPEEAMPADLLKLKDISFADWVKKKSMPEKVAQWIRVSVECEIGTAWDRISALDGLAEFHIFAANGGKGEEAYRVVAGNEKFVNTFADAIGRGNISLNSRVQRVVSRKGKVSVFYVDQAIHKAGQIDAAHVITTIPPFRAVIEMQFDPPLSAKKLAAIQSQTWGSYFKAHIFLPLSAQKFWTRGKNSILPILSDSELGVIYDGNRGQENAKTKIISLLITGDHAERYNLMPMDVTRAQLTAKLDQLWPGVSKEIKGMEFFRLHPRAIGAWPVGRSRFDEMSNELRRPEGGIHLAGDFTETSHSDGAFLSAKRAVRQILQARKTK
ncbi:MAG: FAD-dependent oxidoreductase [Bdellovibrionales bacterium]|nr:FAD-dependent oxidoreductase [Bdellovibrionales bacterium]